MMRVYFAHAMWDYGTEREAQALGAIQHYFGKSTTIVNPPDLAGSYDKWKLDNPELAEQDPMLFFRKMVNSCNAVVYMPDTQGYVGPGVAAEALEAHVSGKKVYIVRIRSDGPEIAYTSGPPCIRVLTIAEARKKFQRRA